MAKGRSSPPAEWREEDITQLSDDAFESVLRELVECKPQARSSSLVRSLRREVCDQEELFDGSLHALPTLLSSSSSSTASSGGRHHRPGGGGSVSLQDLASSPSSMPPSGLLRPRGGGVPNPAGRGMRHVAASRVMEVRAGRLDGEGAEGPHGAATALDDEDSKASAAVAALSCRTDEPPKLPLLVRPKADVELVTLKNGSVASDEPLDTLGGGGGPRRVATVRYDAFAKDSCSEKEAGIRMPTYGGEATTLAAIAHSRSRDGEPHTNNVAFSIRKNKKSRNHVDPTVMAEEMTGHRGSDSIDTLLAYIYSDDKGGAPHSANSNGGNGTAPGSTDNRKGKNVRKGVSATSSNAGGAKNSLSSPPPGTAADKDMQRGLSEDVVNNNFDSSHRRAVFEDAPLVVSGSPGEKERSFSPSFYSDYGIDTEPAGSYRVDLSSFSDVDQIQESEFRLVTKKQRRRAQLKKASTTACEGFQRQLGAGGSARGAAGNGPVEDSSRRPGVLDGLSAQHQQQQQRGGGSTQSMLQEPPATVAAGGGRQHNYTESAPPSEPSSPENSDLDSVHSLPVGGHGSAATATIVQTSYADIARMSCRARGGGGANGVAASVAPAENPVVPSQPETPVGPTSQETETVVVVAAPPPPATPSGVEEEEEAGGDGSRSPPVVLLDDGALPVPLGEITFGFDVNEQLVRMSLDSQFHSVPSGGTTRGGEGGEPAAPPAVARAAVASPRFDDCRPEELGRFNHRDVVDFLDWEWVRACQSIEKEGSSDSKPRVLYYYCDSSSTGPRQQNS